MATATMESEAAYTIAGETGDWEIVVGMEIHAQVISTAKLFSGASTAFGAEPNSHVSFIDAGFPGMLPVINEECVRQAVRTGLALNAAINKFSRFDRKNYFYPDLPQGYQISQYSHPVVGEGEVALDLGEGRTKTVGIERLHLEQDAGKSMHDQHPGYSLIDYNRSGVALMEIVTKPDIRSPEQAGAFLRKLRTLLRYIGACDGNMEQGSMRADINVSVRKPGDPPGTRCEIKNVNSVRFVMQAVEYEARRQVDLLEAGERVELETRLFNPDTGETRTMRTKEEAHDYRYFPDPDLLPLEFGDDFIASARASLPELPDAKKARFMEELVLPADNAGTLVAEKESAEYFEALLADLARRTGKAERELAVKASNWVVSDLFGYLNKNDIRIANSPVGPSEGAELLALIDDGTISNRTAKEVFEEMTAAGRKPGEIVEEKGLKQVSDAGELDGIVDSVLAENQAQVEQYKGGKTKVLGFFVGQVMKQTGGQANPQVVNDLLKQKLDG